jgi:hypothetical protein
MTSVRKLLTLKIVGQSFFSVLRQLAMGPIRKHFRKPEVSWMVRQNVNRDCTMTKEMIRMSRPGSSPVRSLRLLRSSDTLD